MTDRWLRDVIALIYMFQRLAALPQAGEHIADEAYKMADRALRARARDP